MVYLRTGNSSSDSCFRGYTVSEGPLKTKTPFGVQWERYQAPAIYDAKAYVNGGGYGGAYSFDLATGEQRWFTSLAQDDGWTPAINDRHLVAYVGGTLTELDRNTGVAMQNMASPAFSWNGWTSSTPVLDGDFAYISSGCLVKFDLTQGKGGMVLVRCE